MTRSLLLAAGFLCSFGAVRASATEAQDLIREGHSQHGLGRLTEAAFDYRRAISADRKDTEAQLDLGVALYQLGRSTEAAGELRESIRSGSRDPLAQMMLALAGSDPAESRGAYRLAVQREPAYGAPGFDPDDVLLKRGLLPKKAPRSTLNRERWTTLAAAEAPPAVPSLDGNAAALDAIGLGLEAEGKFDQAVAAFLKAAALTPGSPKIHGHLAAALSAQSERPNLSKERAADLRRRAAAEYVKAASLSLE